MKGGPLSLESSTEVAGLSHVAMDGKTPFK